MKESHQLINQDSGTTEWYTPANIVEAARKTLGWFDLDPASSEKANELVQAKKIYTIHDDGLSKPWNGTVWMNHPFGRKTNEQWVNKLVYEYVQGNVLAACCITFASTSERWFQPLLRFPQCFLYPRTNYLSANGKKIVGATKGSVVTYLGNYGYEFNKNFQSLGAIKVVFTDWPTSIE
jgi:hypothetical protein